MDASIVSLIINLVLVLFVLFGFLWGIGRGFKKSLVRLVYLLVFVVIFAFASPYISSALLNINIPQSTASSFVEGAEIPAEGASVNDIIALMLNGTPENPTEIGKLCENNPALGELIEKFPAVMVNLIVFVILVFVAKFMSYIGFRITCAIHFKKDKKKKKGEPQEKQYAILDGKPVIIEKEQPPAPKKHRLLGGLVGAFQGLALMFCFFLPITGFVGIAGQFIDTKSVQAETAYAESGEYEYIQKFIKENVDPEIIKYFVAYKDSFANKALSLGGIDQVCFDVISSTTINGEPVKIRQEINTVAKVTDSILYVQDVTSQENFQFSELDLDKLEDAVSTLFDSGLIRSVGDQLLMNYLEYAISDEPTEDEMDQMIDDAINGTGYGDTIRRLLNAIYVNFQTGTATDTLKADLLALLGVGSAVLESGLVDDMVELGEEYGNHLIDKAEYQDRLITTIIDALSAKPNGNENNYLTIAFESLLSSATIQSLIAETINIGIDEMKTFVVDNICKYDEDYNNAQTQNVKDQIRNQISNSIVFDSVSVDSINWKNFASDFGNIFSELINLYNFSAELEESNNLETNAEIKAMIESEGFKNAIYSMGKVVDGFLNLEIFTGTVNESNLIDQILTNFNKTYILDINEEPQPRTNFFDLTEFGVKNAEGQFIFGEKISDLFYDMSLLMLEPLSVEDIAEFDFANFNYFGKTVGEKHIKGAVEVFDEFMQLPIFQAISTNILTQFEEEMFGDAKTKEFVDSIFGVLIAPSNNQSLSDVRAEFTNIVSTFAVLGESGLLNIMMTMVESDATATPGEPGDDPASTPEPEEVEIKAELFNDLINGLLSIKGENTEKQVDRAISYLFDSNIAKQLMISAVNQFLLPQFAEVENPNNGITIEYTGFDQLEADAKIIATAILTIWQNLEIDDETNLETAFTDMNDATSLIFNDNFATAQTGTASLLGQILDKLTNSPMLTYDATPEITTDDVTENLVEKLLSEYGEAFGLYLEEALCTTAPANFWQTEFTNLAPALVILNNTNVDEETTALMMLLGGDPMEALDALSEQDSDTVLNILLNSSILKNITVGILNTANETLIKIIDEEATIEEACDTSTNLKAQATTLKAVLKSAIACKDITDLGTALAGEDKENVKALLNALEQNSEYATGQQGVFYDAYNNYFKPYKTLVDGLDSEQYSTNKTLLDAVLEGENITAEALEINATKLQNVIGALIDCELLNSYTIKVFNDINIKLITLIDEDYNQEVCDSITDFKAQKSSLLEVVAKAQICKDITSLENLTGTQQQAVQDLISALKANVQEFHSDGVFQVAYTQYFIDYEIIS